MSKSGLFAKISKITIINLLAQLISVIGFSINSKLYGAEVIGGFVVVLSYSSIISILSTGYLEQSFFVKKNEGLYKYLMISILYLSTLVTLASSVFLYVLNVSYIFFIAINIFSESMLKTITSYNIANNKILFISYSRLVLAPIIPGLYFVFYKMFGAEEIYLILISSCCNLLFAIIITIVTLNSFKIKFKFYELFKFKIYNLLIKRYFKFVKYSMTGELMRTIAFRGPTIVLEKYFGKEVAGFYGIANRIVLMPILIFVGTVSQIYIERISNFKKQNKKIMILTANLLKLLSIATIIGFSIYFVFGKWMINILLGNEFEEVYYVIISLLPYALAIIVFNPIFSVYSVFEKQEFLFKMKAGILCLSIISFSIAIILNNYILGLSLFSLSIFVVYVLYGVKSLKIIKKYDKKNN
ncbi:Polysaccharide biosynthesis protein [Lutibacter oricola]|uniref:Polysaccharide biosynthesis protein n=2 Tax=Lutibacter oricola TaxID=762486 RepID=A0A1H2TPY9_9FLAO|nr:Polysaccharide biosynthesis protein [Lutibacter oricola]